MPRRVIVSLTLAVMTCFLLLSYLDPRLLFVHLYESLIYLAILILLVRVDARWVYTLGMLAPACWLVLILIPTAWALLLVAPGDRQAFCARCHLCFVCSGFTIENIPPMLQLTDSDLLAPRTPQPSEQPFVCLPKDGGECSGECFSLEG